MSEDKQQDIPQLDVLKVSTDLQSDLLRGLRVQSRLANMMTQVVGKTHQALNADACTIFGIDPGGKSATQLAGTGYQEQFNGKGDIRVVPADRVPDEPEEGQELGLTGWILSTGKPFLARTSQELAEHPHHSGKRNGIQTPGQVLRLQSFLGVPVRGLHGEIVGVIKAERRLAGDESGDVQKAFSIGDQLALETLARVASRCITYQEMAQEGQEKAAVTAWARDVIAEAVTTEGELDSFLDIVVNVAAASMHADSCGIFLIDESGNTLTQRAGIGSQALHSVIRSYQLPDAELLKDCIEAPLCVPGHCPCWHERDGETEEQKKKRVGLTAWIAATGKSFHASDFEELSAHCAHQGGFDRWNFPEDKGTVCGAFLGVPLQIGGTVIGVVKVENISERGKPDDRDFSQEDQRRFEILAQDIALAIMRLQAHIPTRYRIIRDAQPTILEILRGGLNLSQLVRKVVDETRKLFNAGACALFLKEGNKLIQPPWAASGWAQRGPRVREYDLVDEAFIEEEPLDGEKVGLTVWIAVKQEKFTARSNLELRMHPHHKGTFDEHNFEEGERCESFMGFPLLIKEDDEDRLVGVLKVESKMSEGEETPGYTYFNELDELVFELIANSAAIAIQNARLLESRRLADQVLAQPHSGEVVRALYEFLQGREEVMSTLDHTAKTVRGESPTRAEIVQEFSRLLEPGFADVILGQLANQVGTPISNLLRFIRDAIRVENTAQFSRLYKESQSAESLPVAALSQPRYFLRECTQILVTTLQSIGERLGQYAREPAKRTTLKQSLQLLEGTQGRLRELSLFERNVLGKVFENWHRVIREELDKFQEIPNPYIVGPPVRSDRMFRGREDIFEFVSQNLSGADQDRALVLHGQRRTGKTSILYQLAGGRLGENCVPVFIDMQELALIESTAEFLDEVAYRIVRAAQNAGIAIQAPHLGDKTAPHTMAFSRFLDELEASLGQRRAVIMFDEFEVIESKIREGKLDKNVLQYLRSLLQHRTRLTFIFTGAHRLEEMGHDYWSVFFNIALYRRVSFLRREEAVRLIRDPVADALDIEKQAVDEIIRLTRGHPYFIQLICWALVNHCNAQKRNAATIDDVNQAVREILAAGEAHFAYIWTQAQGIERLALAGLANASHPNNRWTQPGKILETLSASGAEGIQRKELVHALDHLVAMEVLETAPRGSLRYRFQVEVLRLWVEETKSIASILERGQ
jgi:GAF domain-containing protein/AAA+ ATPase superfamily predicted ATPase